MNIVRLNAVLGNTLVRKRRQRPLMIMTSSARRCQNNTHVNVCLILHIYFQLRQ